MKNITKIILYFPVIVFILSWFLIEECYYQIPVIWNMTKSSAVFLKDGFKGNVFYKKYIRFSEKCLELIHYLIKMFSQAWIYGELLKKWIKVHLKSLKNEIRLLVIEFEVFIHNRFDDLRLFFRYLNKKTNAMFSYMKNDIMIPFFEKIKHVVRYITRKIYALMVSLYGSLKKLLKIGLDWLLIVINKGFEFSKIIYTWAKEFYKTTSAMVKKLLNICWDWFLIVKKKGLELSKKIYANAKEIFELIWAKIYSKSLEIIEIFKKRLKEMRDTSNIYYAAFKTKVVSLWIQTKLKIIELIKKISDITNEIFNNIIKKNSILLWQKLLFYSKKCSNFAKEKVLLAVSKGKLLFFENSKNSLIFPKIK